jgi:hypothetical protein
MEVSKEMLEQEARIRNAATLGLQEVPLTGKQRRPGQQVVARASHTVRLRAALANPRLTLGKKTVTFREGCLSVPSYTALVPRAADVLVRWTCLGLSGYLLGWQKRKFGRSVAPP